MPSNLITKVRLSSGRMNLSIRILFTICLLITLSVHFSCKTAVKSISRKSASKDTLTSVKNQIVTGRGNQSPDSSGIKKGEIALTGASPDISDSSRTGDSIKIKPKKAYLEDIVKYQAEDSIIMDARKKIIYLYGTGVLDYTTINLQAQYIEIDMNTKTLFARGVYDTINERWIGKPVFKDQDKSFTAEELTYNFDTKKGVVKQVITQEGEGYLHGQKVKYLRERFGKDTVNVVYVKHGQYTTCNQEHPHFAIKSNKIKVIPGKQIITGPANLVVEDVPTPLVLPFGFFPNSKTQKSGILFPQYGVLNNVGFFLRDGGYYWAISDKVNLKAVGSIFTNGSWGLNAGSAYKQRYKYSGNVSFAFARRLDGFDPKVVKEFSRSNQWSFRWTHTQDPKARPNSSFKADVNIVTSDFNKFNQLQVNNFVQNTFQSNISYSLSIPRTPFSVSVNLRHDQNTSTRIVNISLPEITWTTNRFFPFKPKKRTGSPKWWQQIYEGIGIRHRTDFSNRITTRDSLLFKRDAQQGFKGVIFNGVRHTFEVNNSFKLFNYLNMTPSFNYTEYWNFKKTRQRFDNSTGQTVIDTLRGFFTDREYNVSVNFNTNIFGFYTFKKGAVKAIRHVFTPNISFNYNPNFNRTQWGYFGPNGTLTSYNPNAIGIFGGPLTNAAGAIGFSLVNNLEMKVKSAKDTVTGEKKIKLIDNFTISGNYNLIADSLNLSPIAIQARTAFFDNKLNLVFSAQLDPYALDAQTQKIRINTFQFKQNKQLARLTNLSLNLSYSLIGKRKQNPKANPATATPEEIQYVLGNPQDFLDFNIPYSLQMNYVFNYSKPQNLATVSNNLSLSGDFSITRNWKIDFRTQFDFRLMTFSPSGTSIGINRDLHCWQMDLQWIPFGTIASYVFTIRAKSAILQDLKLNRRRGWNPIAGTL